MLRKIPAVFAEVCYSSVFCDCPAAGLQSGDERGAASGSQSCTHVERVLQQQGGGGRGQLPKGRAVPTRGAVCAGGGAAQGGGGGRTRGGQAGSIAVSRVLLSSMHAHTLQHRGPSGRRDRRAPGGTGRQAGRRALLRPEAVVVLWGKAERGNRGAQIQRDTLPDKIRSRRMREKPGMAAAGPGRAMPGEPAGTT